MFLIVVLRSRFWIFEVLGDLSERLSFALVNLSDLKGDSLYT